MAQPEVTVYVVSHNYARFLGDAVESVLRQCFDSWELLIIDDGSTDDTPRIIDLYKGDTRVRTFRTPGIGLPAVCNLALKEARGKYIIRLDGDDVFDENILLVLSNYLDRNEDIALVFPDYYVIDEHGLIFAQERRKKIGVSNHVLDVPAHGAGTMVRRSVLTSIGGYREDLGAQDGFDLWSRLAKTHRCANLNLPLFYYRRHGQNLTENVTRILRARQRIKKDAIVGKLSSAKPIIAVLPCRQKYDFCSDLWNRQLGKRTLLERAIEKSVNSDILDHIVVTSDNPFTQGITRQFSDPRLDFFLRKKEDTLRSRSIVETLSKIVPKFDPEWKGTTVICYPNAVFASTETLEEAIFTLIMNDATSSLAVQEVTTPLFKRASFGLEVINPRSELNTDFGTVYRETQTVLATRNPNLKTGSLTGSCIVSFVVPTHECFLIESERDLRMAEAIEEEANEKRRHRRSKDGIKKAAG